MKALQDLIVASNRLPITIDRSEGAASLQNSSGGLVSALTPILEKNGGTWVGWSGTEYDAEAASLIERSGKRQHYSFAPIFLSAAERASFYQGFSNESLWPLFHALSSRCHFDSSYWAGYCEGNQKFTAAIAAVARPDSFLWVNDYHLMMVPQLIRSRGMKHELAYFHHIPFPPPDVFAALPWRAEILNALMACDTIGFQTQRDRRNFVECVREFLPHARVKNHTDKIVVCPVSINFEQFAEASREPGVVASAEQLRRQLRTALILGLDRLDYTKGIPERLSAFQELLERSPQWRGNVTLIQVVVPSREGVPEYDELRHRIETLVSKINGRFSTPSWTAVQYFYRSLTREELLAFYRAADVALVTPLRDGMNLVSKEFCAVRTDSKGVLVLSEFAGAVDELKRGALIVNPYDTSALASTIHQALTMGEMEQKIRMDRMRAQIRSSDIFYWSRTFTDHCLNRAERAPVSSVFTHWVPA
jgi:trehalose 6-phosphate synthase/phosphatase